MGLNLGVPTLGQVEEGSTLLRASEFAGCTMYMPVIISTESKSSHAFVATFLSICGIHLMSFLLGFHQYQSVCIMATAVVEHLQVWRLLTAVLVHGSLMHLGFNMLIFVPISQSLENMMGTVMVSYLIMLLILVAGSIYVIGAYAIWFLGVYPMIVHHCAIGFSGIIFGLIVVDNHNSGASHRSILGLFTVSDRGSMGLLELWSLYLNGRLSTQWIRHASRAYHRSILGLFTASPIWIHHTLRASHRSIIGLVTLRGLAPEHQWHTHGASQRSFLGLFTVSDRGSIELMELLELLCLNGRLSLQWIHHYSWASHKSILGLFTVSDRGSIELMELLELLCLNGRLSLQWIHHYSWASHKSILGQFTESSGSWSITSFLVFTVHPKLLAMQAGKLQIILFFSTLNPNFLVPSRRQVSSGFVAIYSGSNFLMLVHPRSRRHPSAKLGRGKLERGVTDHPVRGRPPDEARVAELWIRGHLRFYGQVAELWIRGHLRFYGRVAELRIRGHLRYIYVFLFYGQIAELWIRGHLRFYGQVAKLWIRGHLRFYGQVAELWIRGHLRFYGQVAELWIRGHLRYIYGFLFYGQVAELWIRGHLRFYGQVAKLWIRGHLRFHGQVAELWIRGHLRFYGQAGELWICGYLQWDHLCYASASKIEASPIAGELWIRGHLQWVHLRHPSASKIEASPIVQHHLLPLPSYVKLPAHPGGLPITVQDASSAQRSAMQPSSTDLSNSSIWTKVFRQPGGGPQRASQLGPTGQAGPSRSGTQVFQGAAYEVGGGASSEGRPHSATAAAAAAAEARAAADLEAKLKQGATPPA
eukprot:gene10175-8080_t